VPERLETAFGHPRSRISMSSACSKSTLCGAKRISGAFFHYPASERLAEGPPKRTARDIVAAVELYFEILSLASSHFGANVPAPPRAWVCLMRKRAAD
jgi:hypothetical protein